MYGRRFDYEKTVAGSNQKAKSCKKNSVIYCQKTLRAATGFGFMLRVSSHHDSASRQRLTVLYSGRVQGVGFRYTAKTVATGYEVTGTVRNLPDGRVELIAEGSQAELEAFRVAIPEAGLAGFIRDEQVTWSAAENKFKGFEIAH